MSKNGLPHIDDWEWKLKSYKPDIVWVSVKDIVGVANPGYLEYNPDWSPKQKDRRWQRIYDAVKAGKNIEELGSGASPITLYKTPDGKFWVAGNGNHRISVAKVLGIKKVRAEVYYLLFKK